MRINLNRFTLCILPLYVVLGYLIVWYLPENMQPAALTACARERIAYYALEHGEFGNKIAHFVYPKIERDTKAGRSIAFDYGSQLLYKERDEEVIELFERNLKSFRKAYGDKDGRTIWAMISLAIAYRDGRQFENSMACANEVLDAFKGQPLCEEVVCAYRQLRYNYSDMEDYENAVSTCEKLVAMEEAFGGSPLHTNFDRQMLSYCYRDAGQFDKQAEVLKKIAEIKNAENGKGQKALKSRISFGCKIAEEKYGLFDLVK
ncbi:MAG: tetratricopeptide repeat protein [Candidatus Melainabacteria bacterium]|nr:MAG: tetratricopeptide repeat protein [Candidatus Melainabacteria bacterium]